MPALMRRRLSPAVILFAAAVPWFGGCTTPAQREVYEQELAGEVRILEDQLYEADYENRILRDELDACRRKQSCGPNDVDIAVPTPPMLPVENPLKGERMVDPVMIDASSSYYPPPPISDPLDLGIDDGRVVAPERSQRSERSERSEVGPGTDEVSSDAELSNDSKSLVDDPPRPPVPQPDPAANDRKPFPFDSNVDPEPLTDPGRPLPPAPTLPQPPGASDLLPDPLIEGDVLPPAPGVEDIPAGKVELPDLGRGGQKRDQNSGRFARDPFVGSPTGLTLHPSSGPKRVDGGRSNDEPMASIDPESSKTLKSSKSPKTPTDSVIWVRIQAVDQRGRAVDLTRYDIDAELSILVTDPAAELPLSPEPYVLGRWEFTATQTAAMVGDDPVAGIHVPIRWGSRRPAGDEVHVVARLRGQTEVLRCDAAMSLTMTSASISNQWLPRGEDGVLAR